MPTPPRPLLLALVLTIAPTLAASCIPDGPPYFISGSARLPACTEAPAEDFDGTRWADMGIVMITSDGCEGSQAGDELPACSLTWEFSQTGNDLDILVDEEYEIRGRMCGDTLHLEGGWWLPVEDGEEGCTYEDDSAAEVGIEAGGNTLAVTADELTGGLWVRAECTADYAITLLRLGTN